jgi:hypothetical protein
MDQYDCDAGGLTLDPARMADLVVDVWRIQRRATRDGVTDPVRVACERAVERLSGLGFELKEMVGDPYHENLCVRVVHEEGGKGKKWISECLSPAVYFQSGLIRRAEIVIRGDEQNGAADC